MPTEGPPIHLSSQLTSVAAFHISFRSTEYFVEYAYYNVTPCSPVQVHRQFGGTYCLYLHGRARSKPRKLHETNKQKVEARLFLAGRLSTLRPCGWKRYIPLKRRQTRIGLHGVISQARVPFIPNLFQISALSCLHVPCSAFKCNCLHVTA
jgi:hypothetical protein